MSCNARNLLILTAGDAWSVPFRYTVAGTPEALPDGAQLDIREAGTGRVLVSATIGDGLSFEMSPGDAPVKNIIRLDLEREQTKPLAVRGKRTDALLGLAVFEPGDESGSWRTIATVDLVVKPPVAG